MGSVGFEIKVNDGHDLGRKIVIIAVVIFFAAVMFYLYNRLAQILFYVSDDLQVGFVADCGLEPAVIASLPIFEYSSNNRTEPEECAVCLSEFEENDKGRILPKCKHCFHVECIDKWFYSHSTCPLCRSLVELFHGPDMNEPAGSNSGLCSEDNEVTASLGARRKGIDLMGIRVEVPVQNELDPESPLSSPASCGFKSFKRILSMNMRTPSGPTTSLRLSTELDLECGGCVTESPRALTP